VRRARGLAVVVVAQRGDVGLAVGAHAPVPGVERLGDVIVEGQRAIERLLPAGARQAHTRGQRVEPIAAREPDHLAFRPIGQQPPCAHGARREAEPEQQEVAPRLRLEPRARRLDRGLRPLGEEASLARRRDFGCLRRRCDLRAAG